MKDLRMVLVLCSRYDSQICLTSSRSIISWKISPPLSPTNLVEQKKIYQLAIFSISRVLRGLAYESSSSGSFRFSKGDTFRVSWLKAGLGTGRPSLHTQCIVSCRFQLPHSYQFQKFGIEKEHTTTQRLYSVLVWDSQTCQRFGGARGHQRPE